MQGPDAAPRGGVFRSDRDVFAIETAFPPGGAGAFLGIDGRCA